MGMRPEGFFGKHGWRDLFGARCIAEGDWQYRGLMILVIVNWPMNLGNSLRKVVLREM